MNLPANDHMRWRVVREYLRPARFGEYSGAPFGWAVYVVLQNDQYRVRIGGPTFFTSRLAALNYAHSEARRHHGHYRPRKDKS